MIAISEIKKDEETLDEVLGSYRGQKAEEERRIVIPERGLVTEIFKHYMFSMDGDKTKSDLYKHDLFDKQAPTPEQVNTVLQLMHGFGTDKDNGLAQLTGLFVSMIIEASYKAGHNNFKLNTRNMDRYWLFAHHIRADKERPLTIDVEGDVYDLAFGSSNVIATINGNAGQSFGCGAEGSKLHIKGDVGENFACGASGCTFTVDGNVHAELMWGVERNTFKTPNEKTLAKFIERTEEYAEYLGSEHLEGYNIVFIDPDGHEETVWQYGSNN